MDELADLMIDEGFSSDEIMDATGMDEEELAEKYLENGYGIKDTADELGLDEEELLEQHGDDYEYE